MKKVNWRWEYGVYMSFCPYCNEPTYDEEKCVFCGKPYEWVEGKHKTTIINHEGYTIVQCTNNHIQIYYNDRLVFHASCTKKMTDDELKGQVAFLERIRKERGS